MDYRSEVRNGRLVVSIAGMLTFDEHETFRRVINEIAEGEATTIEINLATTKMIDSAGIGMLLLAKDKAVKTGKTLCLSGVTGHVAKVIELAKVEQIIPIE